MKLEHLIQEKTIIEAFQTACRVESENKPVEVYRDREKLVIARKDGELKELLSVEGSKIKILKRGLPTARILISALNQLQIDVTGQLISPYLAIVFRKGILQRFPVIEDVEFDMLTREFEYTGQDPGIKRVVEVFRKFNELFKNAAKKYGPRAVEALAENALPDLDFEDMDGLRYDVFEEILQIATDLAEKKFWFFHFKDCIVVKVEHRSGLKEEHAYYLIMRNGISTPFVPKSLQSASIAKILWGIEKWGTKPRFSWENPKAGKVLEDLLERVKKVEVAGKDEILHNLIHSMPSKAKATLISLLT